MIQYHTLNDHLLIHGITREEACILFGRTLKTLKRWNEKPPEWVIRIIQLMGKKPPFPDCWNDWYFDRNWIVSPEGNGYSQRDILASKYAVNAYKGITGEQSDITILKNELERKINILDSDIRLTVNIGEEIHKFKIAL